MEQVHLYRSLFFIVWMFIGDYDALLTKCLEKSQIMTVGCFINIGMLIIKNLCCLKYVAYRYVSGNIHSFLNILRWLSSFCTVNVSMKSFSIVKDHSDFGLMPFFFLHPIQTTTQNMWTISEKRIKTNVPKEALCQLVSKGSYGFFSPSQCLHVNITLVFHVLTWH